MYDNREKVCLVRERGRKRRKRKHFPTHTKCSRARNIAYLYACAHTHTGKAAANPI